MRRIQIHLQEELDDAAEAEAARRGVSKAALFRDAVAHELEASADRVRPLGDPVAAGPLSALTGWLDDDPVDDIDEELYGSVR